jgi:hypothetical protein
MAAGSSRSASRSETVTTTKQKQKTTTTRRQKKKKKESPVAPDAEEQSATRGHALLLCVLCLAPPLLVLAKLGATALVFPYWDEWRFAEILQKFHAGQAGFADFWSQHNEHRILFPRLVMLALAQLSGWNVAWEIGASLVFALVIYFAALRAFLRCAPQADLTLKCIGAALFSLLVFSWTQNENWVWGFQSNVWLAMAAVVLATAVLASQLSYAARVGAGIALAIVATYSYANGMIFWAAALPLLWDLRVERQRRIAGCVVWIAVAALVAESYFYGYAKPDVSPPLGAALGRPLLFLQFFAVLIGAPLSTFFTMPAWHGVDAAPPVWALLPGPIAIIAFAALAFTHWRRGRDWSALAPWLTLAGFSLASALIASAGRGGFGLGQALTSRYITVTTPFWIALAALGLMALGPYIAREARNRSFAVGLTALFTLTALFGAANSSAAHEQRCHWKRMGWLAIRAGLPHPLFLHDLSDQPEQLGTTQLPWLAQEKLCGLGVPLEAPAQYAPQFLRDAAVLDAMALPKQAAIYVEIALKLDPAVPGAAELLQKLRTAPQPSPAAGTTGSGR